MERRRKDAPRTRRPSRTQCLMLGVLLFSAGFVVLSVMPFAGSPPPPTPPEPSLKVGSARQTTATSVSRRGHEGSSGALPQCQLPHVDDQGSVAPRTTVEMCSSGGDLGGGASFLMLRNVCVDLKPHLKLSPYVIYVPEGSHEEQAAMQEILEQRVIRAGDAFKWGALNNVEVRQGLPARSRKDVVWHSSAGDSDVALLLAPPWDRAVGHIWDVLGSTWHAIAHSDQHPWVQNVSSLVMWTTAPVSTQPPLHGPLMKFFSHLFSENRRMQTDVPVFRGEDLREQLDGLHCYDRAVLPGMASFGYPQRPCSIFPGPQDAESFRAALFSYYKVPPPPPGNRAPARVFFIDRCPSTRCIKNHAEIIAAIAAEPKLSRRVDLEWIPPPDAMGHFESYTFENQMKYARSADILIGAHGSALFNVPYMETGSTVIEMFHPGLYEPSFFAAAIASGMHYKSLEVHGAGNCKRVVPEDCHDIPPLKSMSMPQCKQPFKFCDIQLDADDIGHLLQLIFEGVQTTFALKRHSAEGVRSFSLRAPR